MVESAFVNSVNSKLDRYFFFAFLSFWILYHIAFFIYAIQIRKEEQLKLFFSSDEIEQEVNLLRPSLHFDYTKRLRSGLFALSFF
ncbi:hypothetical protein RFI_29820 [Reticulomyxa filosa]|uniref:Uncharacterized protein n=1 Tax=Reticulomyxa filosa TaxID=46433 RepID=X6M2D0_RETFI|nr:hypothetical protein RFI_29820 [Reticulomyxa filosa]|eukprot:ETO07572.1 hypothetical protein RFI_29820 [Reticulomyxa filosa]